MIYLDSAATTLQKPPEVAMAAARAIRQLASPGRGGHRDHPGQPVRLQPGVGGGALSSGGADHDPVTERGVRRDE